jgi:DNA invertase Pin-like site-specific DNA recombinase
MSGFGEWAHKVRPEHLRRDAWLYVRQSTLRQVVENTESTERQYAMRERALALGWPLERIHVIDSDLGRSGAERDRKGFQQLVAEVSLGRAGIVLGLEVSRLARNSTDWHRLLEICALADTLILDEDGIYDPAHFNDRLLLGLKGTMSEAELHVLRARLHGGVLNAARRGELKMRLPVGFAYDEAQRVILDPDQQIQGALRLLFETFERTGSATATVKAFRQQGGEVPDPSPCRSRQGTTVVGRIAGLAGAAHSAQPPLCRCLRLRAQPHPPRYGRSQPHPEAAARSMENSVAGGACRLHRLGALRSQRAAVAR